MSTARRRTWVWHFERPSAEIWPIMADTARFNEAAALPKHDIEEIPQADGSVLYLGSLPWGWKSYRDHERKAAATVQPDVTGEAAASSAAAAATFPPAPDDAEDERPARLN